MSLLSRLSNWAFVGSGVYVIYQGFGLGPLVKSTLRFDPMLFIIFRAYTLCECNYNYGSTIFFKPVPEIMNVVCPIRFRLMYAQTLEKKGIEPRAEVLFLPNCEPRAILEYHLKPSCSSQTYQ